MIKISNSSSNTGFHSGFVVGLSLLLLLLASYCENFFLLAYAQPEMINPPRPVTSKVIASNITVTESSAPFYKTQPVTSKVIASNITVTESSAPFYKTQPVTSKVIASNFTAPSSATSTSFTVTNATVTFFSDETVGELVTNTYVSSVSNSSLRTITGNMIEGYDATTLGPMVQTVVIGRTP
jgi:hypothetical protein